MRTWAVVASAARARVFEVTGRQDPWQELMDLVNSDDRLFRRDLTSDKPGRALDTSRGQRHTYEPPVDPKEEAADRFARLVVDKLRVGLRDQLFEQLTIVAPPHFLGLLREHMDEQLSRAVTHEVVKDLTREDAATLKAHVAGLA